MPANPFDEFDALDQQQMAAASAAASAPPANPFDEPDKPTEGFAEGLAHSVAEWPTLGFGDELAAGLGSVGNSAARGLGMDIPERTYRQILDEVRGSHKGFEKAHPVASTAGEIAGGFLIPGGVAARGVATASKAAGPIARAVLPVLKSAVKVGAPVGAASAIGDAEDIDTAGQYLGTGLKGALYGAGGYAAGVPIAYGLGRAGQAIGRAVGDAVDPYSAALRKWAEAAKSAKIDPADVRRKVAPDLSQNLTGRGLTEADVSAMINRSAAGETFQDIARSYGITPATVSGYVGKFREQTAVPSNFLDLVQQVSREQGRAGAEEPMMNLARAAAGQGETGPAMAAERLVQRQLDQSDRALGHIEALTKGKDPEKELAKLNDVIGVQSKTAYGNAHQNAQPFDLKPAIGKWRQESFDSAGDIKNGIDKAVDLFFEPVMAPNAKGAMTARKLGQPISDLKRYQGARQALDQMVATSMHDGKSTPLTAKLTAFRKDINEIVRKENPLLAAADDQFAGAKSAQKLFEQGSEMALQLNSTSRQQLRDFAKLTPEQQEVVRLGLRQRLESAVVNKNEAADVVAQFNRKGTKEIISSVFPKAEADTLMSRFGREAAGTRTLQKVFSGSRTTPMAQQSLQMLENAKIAANLMTGKAGGVWDGLRNKLAYKLGNQQAEHVLDIATRTDPQKLLPILDGIIEQHAKIGKTSGLAERLRRGIGTGAAAVAGDQ